MSAHRAMAPAKVNLGLFLGPTRGQDGRHELVTVMQSISLADELTLAPAPAGASGDELVCAGVEGPPEANLAAAALRLFRERTGWDAPPQRLEIVKRIPVAAGLGGGSADAAAALRLAVHASGLGDRELMLELAQELGADVPAQVEPGRWLARGVGERLEALPAPIAAFGVLILPSGEGLPTGSVFAEADRLGLARSTGELQDRGRELYSALEHGAPLAAASELLHNDLQRAAVSLRPDIAAVLREARAAGAELSLLSGSGPTVLGLFAHAGSAGGGVELARLAATGLASRVAGAFSAAPVEAAFGAVTSACATIPD
ncbi:MAG TPA: hypothetical protein VII01_12390 [Solirubrobacteraceae bacterium]|jgi:4-diphosphocytidyl-2-C-methyl-D-erythritol kinase